MLLFVVVLAIVAPAADAAKLRVFPNCKAVNKVYKHGIAKNFKVIKKADGLTGRPFVSAKLWKSTLSTGRRHHNDG